MLPIGKVLTVRLRSSCSRITADLLSGAVPVRHSSSGSSSSIGHQLIAATRQRASRAQAAKAMSSVSDVLPQHPLSEKQHWMLLSNGPAASPSIGANFDALLSWNTRPVKAPHVKLPHPSHGQKLPHIQLPAIGIKSLIGRRATNEDRVIVAELRPGLVLFGVFDGHGGSEAVEHVVEFLPGCIAEYLEGGKEYLEGGKEYLEGVLRRAYADVNESFVKLHKQQCREGRKAWSSGTTATVCLLRDGVSLTIAHTGDTRAFLRRDDETLRLTTDHLPSIEAEAERIIACGGHLTWSSLGRSRVNGRLEMTRSIGDVELKEFGVIADPDVVSIDISSGSASFLALTTDGIHNEISSTEVVDLVSSCRDPLEAAALLVDQALFYGSEDNCSALVVPLAAWGKMATSPRLVNYGRKTGMRGMLC